MYVAMGGAQLANGSLSHSLSNNTQSLCNFPAGNTLPFQIGSPQEHFNN